MARSGNLDPLDRFRWKIMVSGTTGSGFVRGGFSECSSPAVTIDYKQYKEGGSHMNPRLIHEGASYKAITLRRGVIAKPDVNDFSKWIDAVFKATKGDKQAFQYRRDMTIEHLDREGNVIKRYTLFNCVPTLYEPASDFVATDDSGYSLESLTFQYEGFKEETVKNSSVVTELIKGLL